MARASHGPPSKVNISDRLYRDLAERTRSLINVATCNATNTSGCDRTPAKKPSGSGPFWVAVDSGSGTASVPNFNSFDVSVASAGG